MTASNKKVVIWLLLGLLILSFGIVGFFVYKHFQLKQQLDEVQPTGVQEAKPSTPSIATETEKTSSEMTPSPAEATPVLERVKVLPTDNWKTVSNNGVRFKIPPEASCDQDNQCQKITYLWDYQGHTIPSYIYVRVSDYTGGSRRQQFLASHAEVANCRPLYQEAMFGSVKALQIAIDGGYCQGSGGGIVAVVGKKLVIFGGGLTYDPKTKVIDRWDIRDTIISTLRPL